MPSFPNLDVLHLKLTIDYSVISVIMYMNLKKGSGKYG